MSSKCCRSRPRCGACPVLLAARARLAAAPAGGDLFALVHAGAPRELPGCVRDALRTLDERRFHRNGRD